MVKWGNESAVGEERVVLSEVDARTLVRSGTGPGFRIAVGLIETLGCCEAPTAKVRPPPSSGWLGAT